MTLEEARARFRKTPAAKSPEFNLRIDDLETTKRDARRLSASAARIVREMQIQLNTINPGQLEFDEI